MIDVSAQDSARESWSSNYLAAIVAGGQTIENLSDRVRFAVTVVQSELMQPAIRCGGKHRGTENNAGEEGL